MRAEIREYSIDGFAEYLRGWVERGAQIRCSFLHHTASPDSSGWRGRATIEAIRDYHRRVRGWSDIACHAYATPDGTVFSARRPDDPNCACQLPARPPSEWPAELRRISGGDRRWPNRHGFGLEVVGNFDREDPTRSVSMRTGLAVLARVHEQWDIPLTRLFFHRDVAYKSCPGERVTRAWVLQEVAKHMDRVDVDVWARSAVEEVVAAGLMTRDDHGRFRGRDPVTRQELAVVLARLLRKLQPNRYG